jgi:hypothetical protein
MAATKIATCCYCGTKAALVLRGHDRHELTCSNCGAPLRALKMLPKQTAPTAGSARPMPRKRVEKYPEHRYERPMKRQKSKGFGRRVMSQIWDVVEDVVDEIFD